MLIKTYRSEFIEKLTPIYDVMEAESIFNRLLEHYLGLRRVDLALRPELVLAPDDLDRWNNALSKLEKNIPIQYIIGSTEFFGLEFKVNEHMLIPRPETEELVDWIIKDYEFKGSPSVLDIGTGSGCIAISVAKNLPDANVSAIDISHEALEIAATNARLNNVDVAFTRLDILNTDAIQHFDCIVSNPPYVRDLEKHEIRRNVLEHEPHLALFVPDDDALLFYRKIASLAAESLSPAGTLYFEINQYLGKETMEMLSAHGFKNIELRKDIFGNDRMIKATK